MPVPPLLRAASRFVVPGERVRAICLDGPLNGLYADLTEATDAGYTLASWPTGEPVFLQDAGELTGFADPIGETADAVWA